MNTMRPRAGRSNGIVCWVRGHLAEEVHLERLPQLRHRHDLQRPGDADPGDIGQPVEPALAHVIRDLPMAVAMSDSLVTSRWTSVHAVTGLRLTWRPGSRRTRASPRRAQPSWWPLRSPKTCR